MSRHPWTGPRPIPKPPCGAKSTQTIIITRAPPTSHVTPPRIISPLPLSELQRSPLAASYHPPSLDGQPITVSTPTIPNASGKERTTTPSAHAPTQTIPTTHPLTLTAQHSTPRNTFCSAVHDTLTPASFSSEALCHYGRSSNRKNIPNSFAPSPWQQTAPSSARSTARLPGRILRKYTPNLPITPPAIIWA
jgi:hypothetical protein